MLMLSILNLKILAITGLITFLSENVVLLTVVGLVLLLIVAIVFRINKKKIKKNRKKRVVTPITDVLGNVSQRVAELNDEIKPFGFAYEPYQDIFYSLMNPWQRQLGYCRLYDEATAAMSMIIDCEPITFDYNGRRWLIEFWKGQYGMNTGAEVGIYNTTGPDLNIPGLFNGTFYFCVKDEECIHMSFAIRKKGNLLFTRSSYHWWLTGFKLGEFSNPDELSMDIVLDLYDRRMAHAFVEALKKVGYKENEYAIQGRRVMVRYNKPHTKQPLTRSAFTEYIMQKNNQNLCDSYNYLTASYTDTIDKLEIIKYEKPGMYDKILRIGKPKEVFETFDKLSQYMKQ